MLATFSSDFKVLQVIQMLENYANIIIQIFKDLYATSDRNSSGFESRQCV